MTTIEYDEMTDDYYYLCHEAKCPRREGPGRMSQRDAGRDADHHDQQHDDGVI